MRVLALDIGTKRTGAALFDPAIGFPMPLTTLEAEGDDLLAALDTLLAERRPEHLVVGLPLLPSGEEGSQSSWVREIAERYRNDARPLTYIDERYSTPPNYAHDGDAAAAVSLLQTFLDLKKKGIDI